MVAACWRYITKVVAPGAARRRAGKCVHYYGRRSKRFFARSGKRSAPLDIVVCKVSFNFAQAKKGRAKKGRVKFLVPTVTQGTTGGGKTRAQAAHRFITGSRKRKGKKTENPLFLASRTAAFLREKEKGSSLTWEKWNAEFANGTKVREAHHLPGFRGQPRPDAALIDEMQAVTQAWHRHHHKGRRNAFAFRPNAKRSERKGREPSGIIVGSTTTTLSHVSLNHHHHMGYVDLSLLKKL